MNRCAVCGRFMPWESLVFKWAYETESLTPQEVEWFECAPGAGCAS